MKIAFVISKFFPIPGGGETNTYALATELSNAGHEVTVITDKTLSNSNKGFAHQFQLRYIDGLIDFSERGGRLRLPLAGLHEVLQELRPQVTHVHNYLPYLLVRQLRNQLAGGVVLSFHNTPQPPNRAIGYFEDPALDLGMARTLLQSDEYDRLLVGADVYEQFATGQGVSRDRIRRAPLGINVARFQAAGQARGLPDRLRQIILPSRIIRRKGILEAVQAMIGLSEYQLNILCLANPEDPAYADEVLESIDSLGLRERVAYPKTVPDYGELPAWYAKSDIVLLPSYYEGLGLAAIEGLAAERPLVATTAAGFSEFLTPENSRLVPAKDPGAIADAIQELDDPRLVERMVREGSQTAARYDIKRQAVLTAAVYEEVC